MADSPYILEMTGIDKVFPGVHALDHCRFNLKEGEIHALIGENGAGKSTLVKIMTGIHSDYTGEYKLFGAPVHFRTIREAQESGISIVHQELNMMNDLTVAQNIFIGRESEGFFCDDKDINRKTARLIEDFEIGVRPEDRIRNLTVGKCQMVEIARAMSYPATKVLILDEPTAALSEAEAEDLFEKMEQLRKRGVAMIFISHRLEEIKRVADRVTVMRDGKYIDTLDAKTCDVQDIVRLMVGREVVEAPKSRSNVAPDAPVVLEAVHLRSNKVRDVSFELHRGEILGFAGLVGAGRTETMRLIYGADPMDAGEIRVHGKTAVIHHSQDAISAGIGYLSEDRKRYGLILGLSVTDNTVLSSYDLAQLHNGIFVNEKNCEEVSAEYVERLKTKTPSVRQLIKNLSGGNQQKVVIAKWLLRDCEILIFDEPTRGIDIGARAEIYHLMDSLVQEGKSVIMVSSDMTEILKMSDRIVVMCEGRKTGELDIADATQDKIMTLATRYLDEPAGKSA